MMKKNTQQMVGILFIPFLAKTTPSSFIKEWIYLFLCGEHTQKYNLYHLNFMLQATQTTLSFNTSLYQA